MRAASGRLRGPRCSGCMSWDAALVDREAAHLSSPTTYPGLAACPARVQPTRAFACPWPIPCSFFSHDTISMCFVSPLPAISRCHSAMDRPYFFSIDGKYDAGPRAGQGADCSVMLDTRCPHPHTLHNEQTQHQDAPTTQPATLGLPAVPQPCFRDETGGRHGISGTDLRGVLLGRLTVQPLTAGLNARRWPRLRRGELGRCRRGWR